MSKKRIVNLSENELVELMDKIVAEAVEVAVAERKKQWIAEHTSNQNSVLEERIKGLESKINSLTEAKK